ncbi:Phospholipid phosphatase 3 [Branchiostoma belcheri]|nr:Phospholipid phosphatase 3 [Branchiostoma belcheri]
MDYQIEKACANKLEPKHSKASPQRMVTRPSQVFSHSISKDKQTTGGNHQVCIISHLAVQGCHLASLCVALPIVILKFAGQPSQRGFFCDDQTISYPFYESTVPTWMLVILTVGIFLFGTLSTQCLTDLFKYTIGRLRPNFLSVCAPDYSRFNCTDAMGRYVYVTDYVCTGDPDQIRESRLSFISGHASLSFFFMVYLVLYLQVRITWRQSWLLKPFLQVVAVILAQLTMLSRVNDNKHHWSDVLAGTALGTFVALLVFSKIYYEMPEQETLQKNPVREEEQLISHYGSVSLRPLSEDAAES